MAVGRNLHAAVLSSIYGTTVHRSTELVVPSDAAAGMHASDLESRHLDQHKTLPDSNSTVLYGTVSRLVEALTHYYRLEGGTCPGLSAVYLGVAADRTKDSILLNPPSKLPRSTGC